MCISKSVKYGVKRLLIVIILSIIQNPISAQIQIGVETGSCHTLCHYSEPHKNEAFIKKFGTSFYTIGVNISRDFDPYYLGISVIWADKAGIGAASAGPYIYSYIRNFSIDIRGGLGLIKNTKINFTPFLGISYQPYRIFERNPGSKYGISAYIGSVHYNRPNNKQLKWELTENISNQKMGHFFLQTGCRLSFHFDMGGTVFVYGLYNIGSTKLYEIAFDYHWEKANFNVYDKMTVASKGSYYQINFGFSFPFFAKNKG